MPQAPAKKRQPGLKRGEKSGKKSIPFDKRLMKPDPDFVDERIEKRRDPESIWQKISNFFD